MAQFGVNSAANLDNPLPGVSEPRPRPVDPPVRREEVPRPRPEQSSTVASLGQPEQADAGARRRIDFYA